MCIRDRLFYTGPGGVSSEQKLAFAIGNEDQRALFTGKVDIKKGLKINGTEVINSSGQWVGNYVDAKDRLCIRGDCKTSWPGGSQEWTSRPWAEQRSTSSGTWHANNNNNSWGEPRFWYGGSRGYAHTDSSGGTNRGESLTYNVPSGAKSMYVSHLNWNNTCLLYTSDAADE